jgi:hypothetical protein
LAANPFAARLDRPWRSAAALLALLLAGPAWAGPREAILRLVPEDAAFVWLITDVRKHAATLADSPFAVHLAGTRFGKQLAAAPEWAKVAEADRELNKHLGVSLADLRDDILGDAAAFAYRAGPTGKPEQEEGLALTWARDPKKLATLLARLDAAQKAAGEVKELVTERHRGKEFIRRVKATEEECYYLADNVLAFAPKADTIRRLIDRAADAGDEEPALTLRLRQLGLEGALSIWWVNPRAFDAELRRRAEEAAGFEAAFQKNFLRYWSALDSVAVFLTAADDLELGIAFQARVDELPATFRRFLKEAVRPSAVWGAVPDEALLALGARVPLDSLAEVAGEFLTDEARAQAARGIEQGLRPLVGADLLSRLPAELGPDWGAAHLPPADKKQWVPDWFVAVKVAEPAAGMQALGPALLDGLHTMAVLASFAWNRQHADALRVQSDKQGSLDVRYLTNDKRFPTGFRPAFAYKEGCLLLAASPDAVRRFNLSAGKVPAGEGEVPLLRVSLRGLAAYLTANRDELGKFLTDANPAAAEQSAKGLDDLAMVTEVFDRLDLSIKPGKGQARVVLRLKPAKPLRK